MNFYQFIIPRLNGKDIEKDFDYYLGLVKKGIAGFIIFGGKLEIVRQGISELQEEAERPLIIASDLERGLGQQLEGGTIFPPAMAVAEAVKENSKFKIQGSKLRLLRRTFKAIAIEAKYAGINTIFAPVLDINTNPKNPIISTRAFGEDAETVSFFGIEMIKAFQANGIAACGKHFPGHGDTEIDSHIGLPLVKKDIQSLEKTEFAPFRGAVKAGVKMIMLAHLKVPALDPSGIPVSLSEKAVRYLRDRMGFKGILITDALNMNSLNSLRRLNRSKVLVEEEASLLALRAGVDLLLHPTDTERVVSYLQQRFSVQPPADPPRRTNGCQLSANTFRKSLRLATEKIKTPAAPDFGKNRRLSEKIIKMSIKIDGQIRPLKKPFLIILNDAKDKKGNPLISALRLSHRNLKYLRVNDGDDSRLRSINDRELIVAVFSSIKAWKGGPSPWLLKCIKELEDKADIFISFGSPYILDAIGKRIGDYPGFFSSANPLSSASRPRRPECGTGTTPFKSPLTKGDLKGCRIGTVPIVKVYAWWDSDSAQKAVAEALWGLRQKSRYFENPSLEKRGEGRF
ncbi:MAG: glycoside hydrolase family 3 N-terminal domain-containing protein [Thermodesulfovibrionales bacterium]|nr:glycoside hydrolase family 3 N-terminal domain-containing protein [Thermodesulfovibrionales bacterium]